MRVLSIVLWATVLAGLAGCGDDSTSTTPDGGPGPGPDSGPGDAGGGIADRPECENLNPVHCLFPWPSDRFLVDDAATETGRRLAIPPEALPLNQLGEHAAPDAFEGFDGFSPMTSIITAYLGEIDTANLPDETRIADSLDPASPTILLDAESGEQVAHFAELDAWPEAEPERRSFYLRPAQRLLEDHHYIVAIRGLRHVGGSPVEPSEYFRALRDGGTTEVAEIEARRAHFEEIFATLETAGVERATLIEAWDFHTASGSNAWGTLLSMRDDAFGRIGAGGVGCTVETVQDDVNTETWRMVTGTFTVPLYMESENEGARLHRGPGGEVAFNRMAEAPFTLVIPHAVRDSVMAGGPGVRLMVYGHGLLGESAQVNSGGTRRTLQRFGMVGVATDWWGLSAEDESVVVNDWITDVGNFPLIAERLTQGVLNFAVLARTFLGACRELPELLVGGNPVIGSEVYYFGISQGGIMGASLAGISPDIDRFVLQVGAISYPIMIRRSVDFEMFENIFELWYEDKLDRDWALVALQNGWDLSEPASFARHLLADPLAGSTAKRILYQTSRYDTEVSNVASDIAARTMGLPWFRSSVYEPWNVTSATDGPSDSGYVIYHVTGVAPIPTGTAIADMDNEAHGGLRNQDAAQRQLDAFMHPDGQVVNFCDGVCDPD